MTQFRFITAAAIAVLIPTLSAAADMPEYARGANVVRAPEITPSESLYVALRGGYNMMNDNGYRAITGTTAVAGGPGNVDSMASYRGGFFASAAIGYDFGEFYSNFGARIEIEGGYFSNAVKSHRVTTTSTAAVPNVVTVLPTYTGANATGSTNASYASINYYVDWLMGSFRPFIGGGVGLASGNINRHRALPDYNPLMDSRDMSVTWNVTAGLAYDINSSWTLETAYRYFRVEDVNVSGINTALGSPVPTSKIALSNHQFMVGVRYKF